MLAGDQDVQLGLDEHQGEGHAVAADGFGLGDDVRHDAGALEGEEPAGAGAAHLDVVHDHQDVVLVAQGADPLEPLHGEGVDAAVGLDGLQDDGRGLLHPEWSSVRRVSM